MLLLSWWTLSLPLYLDALVAPLLLAVALRAALPNLVLLTASSLVLLAALEALVRFAPARVQPYYREHEKFATPEQVYQANVDEEVVEPHGDLAALDPLLPRDVWEPRTIRFRTDRLGYRNSAEYDRHAPVLVGDSFVVGNGTTQADTLAEVLGANGLAVYALAYPSDFIDYERRALWFLSAVDPDAVLALFVFEGNDFVVSRVPRTRGGRRMPPALASALDAYDELRGAWLGRQAGSGLLAYPATVYSLARRVERRWVEREPSTVFVVPIGAARVAFFEPWARAAFEADPGLVRDENEVVARHTACVFFIPDKLRTYAHLVPAGVADGMLDPPPGVRLLERIYAPYGVPVVDLTAPLREAAETLLPSGRYVFWRDDTHWNGNGVRAVAPVVRDCLARNRERVVAQQRAARRCGVAGPDAPAANGDYHLGGSGGGAVETVGRQPGMIVLRGWAADREAGAPADRLVACAGGRTVSSSRPRIARADVGRTLGRDALPYGFELPIPEAVLGKADGLRIYALLAGGRATEVPLRDEQRASLVGGTP